MLLLCACHLMSSLQDYIKKDYFYSFYPFTEWDDGWQNWFKQDDDDDSAFMVIKPRKDNTHLQEEEKEDIYYYFFHSFF